MRTISQRATSALTMVCVLFGVAVAFVGGVAAFGLRANTSVANAVAGDELATSVATARVGQLLGRAYADGEILLSTLDPSQAAPLARRLYDVVLPELETGVADLSALHAGDGPKEAASIAQFRRDWAAMRSVLNSVRPGARVSTRSAMAALERAYAPLDRQIGDLIDREGRDAAAGRQRTDASAASVMRVLAGVVLIAIAGAIALALVGRRVVRRAIDPSQEQVDFADTLQLAQDEDETRHLLQRYLERSIPDSVAVVLNRNNSADRLEAVTDLPADSPLVRTLQNADPHACLAIRAGQTHRESDRHEALLACAVCSGCSGSSICSPLTVGGEVIGAVLSSRPAAYNAAEVKRIRESVSQAAPVLANLRNLAIAEFRAATDSLTGLPNKRAVADTTKRMFAQASRADSNLSLLMLDLDHFKQINDRFGHPVGDQALADVGAALRASLRDSDFAGRDGGEEFCVLLPDTDTDEAHIVAEKIRDAIAGITLPGLDARLTASVGIATYPTHAGTAERLERLADSTLYIAKRSGRDRTEIARIDDAETVPESAPQPPRRLSAPHLGPHQVASPAPQLPTS